MAAKKSSKAVKKNKKQQIPVVSSGAKHEIAGVLLAALTILLLFAVFNFGGSLVTGLFHYLRLGLGYVAYLLPAITAALAVMLFRREDPPLAHNYFGF